MDSERVNEIRARWESMTLSDVELHYEVLHLDAAVRIFIVESHGDIAFLLAENERLQAVVDAARGFVAYEDMQHDAFEALVNTWSERRKHEAIAMNAKFDALRDVLAVYDAT